MGDNNENPTVQEIPADKCVQRTMAVGSPRPAVKEHSPNMGTKTASASPLSIILWAIASERTFPKHGDENSHCYVLPLLNCVYRWKNIPQTWGRKPDVQQKRSVCNWCRVKEHSPNMGTKTVISFFPSHFSCLPVKEHSPNMGTKTTLSSFLFNMSRRCLSERTFPKHGDENQLCLALTFNVFPGERTFPKHGDENFVLSSTLSSFLIVSERTFPKHGDENK